MHSIFSYWHFDVITISFIVLLCLLYLYIINFKLTNRSVYFFSGIIILMIAVASPLHFIGENYLFSAHMISHVLVLLIAAPLIVAGIPQENRFKNSLVKFSEMLCRLPVAAWITGVSIMWIWHVPYIFNQLFMMHDMSVGTAHSMGALMYIHMLSLLIAGFIFSWPVINPYRQQRISSLTAVLYLSTACVFCSLLGLLITFAPIGTYSHYLNAMDMYGYSSLIRNEWGISVATDQQMAGLIMWVPCCFIYLSASMYLLIKWFDHKDVPSFSKINLIK